jgi:hypothetical protein
MHMGYALQLWQTQRTSEQTPCYFAGLIVHGELEIHSQIVDRRELVLQWNAFRPDLRR